MQPIGLASSGAENQAPITQQRGVAGQRPHRRQPRDAWLRIALQQVSAPLGARE